VTFRRDVAQDIKRKMEIGCYQGIRHRKGLRSTVSAPTPTLAPQGTEEDSRRKEEGAQVTMALHSTNRSRSDRR